MRRVGDRLIEAGGQNRRHGGFADVAAQAVGVLIAVFCDQFAEGFDAFYAHNIVKLLAGMGEVLANRFIDFDTAGFQFVVNHAFEQRGAAAAAGAGFGGHFDTA